MRKIHVVLTALFAVLFIFSGCSQQENNTSVDTISVSLDADVITLDQRMVITIETDTIFDSCRYFMVKPSSSEILFAESDKCNTLIFNPKNMPLLFDEGEGLYRVKVIGQNNDRITGIGFERFTFENE